jgi:hypothetical protein
MKKYRDIWCMFYWNLVTGLAVIDTGLTFNEASVLAKKMNDSDVQIAKHGEFKEMFGHYPKIHPLDNVDCARTF